MEVISVNQRRALQEANRPESELEVFSVEEVTDKPKQVKTEWGTITVLPGDYIFTSQDTKKKFGVGKRDLESSGSWEPL